MIIRDPIHGDIELNNAEKKILDCPEVQRLRAIKQLGTAYLVYPGCTHSRFEHSLGTAAIAKRILSSLEKDGPKVSEADKSIIIIAALLHDITHIPFGHTFEDERKIFTRHDKGERLKYFLHPDTDLGRTLDSLGILAETESLLSGERNDWASQIISSSLDADLLDYLKRDAYMAGLAQTYDQRIYKYFRIVDNQLVVNMVKHNMERSDVRSEIMHLLRLRYYLTERVYFHHAKVISGAMICKALELAMQYGLSEHDLLSLGDFTLLEHLKQFSTKHNPTIKDLVNAVLNRQLFKRAYILSGETLSDVRRQELIHKYHLPGQMRSDLEVEIAEKSGLDPSQIILYCPGDRIFREAAIPVITKYGIKKLNVATPVQAEDIGQLERQYENLWRLYVFSPQSHLENVRNTCSEFFGTSSEHI